MTPRRPLASLAPLTTKTGIQRRKPHPMVLEARYMFDGAAVTAAVDAVHADVTALTTNAVAVDSMTHDIEKTVQANTDRTPGIAPAELATRREIVFIDTSIPDWQTLAAVTRNGVEVVLLDPSRDAFDQMAQKLAGLHDVDAIHLVSHGAEGELIVGGQSYQAADLAAHSAALATIGQSLAAGGDFLLYGCDVGRGSSGDALISAIARATHADVAASTDATGAANPWNGNWVLEKHAGEITSALFASTDSLQQFGGKLATVSLTGSAGWTAIMYGVGKDPQGDSQAGAADTDIVGDALHGSLYTAFDNNGTVSTADDTVLFRMRIDNPTSVTNFAGVAIVGMDANLDGRIDLFMSVDGRNNGQAVRLFDPGTGANISPSSTTTSALPTGWLPNNGVYAFSATNYSVAGVSSLNDPNWNGNTDLGLAGGPDAFITWRIPIADLATVLAKASPVDRNGVYGPRGSTGIVGFNENTLVQYVSFTQTQTGPINGDLNGVGANYDKNATFASLGTFTSPMSSANPVSASLNVIINEPIGDGNLSASEDTSVSISGTSASAVANGSWVKVTVTDGGSTIIGYTQVAGGVWTLAGQNLSALGNGTLTTTAELWTTGDNTGSKVVGSSGDDATVLHDKTPPVIGIDAVATGGLPTISGTSDLAAGSIVTLTLDTDNDAATANVVYLVAVQAGGIWSVNTATTSPNSGTIPAAGYSPYTKVSATAADAAGNSSSAVAIDKPTVTSQTTNSTTPTIRGTWGGTNGGTDTLSITVNGVTYNAPTISGYTWSVALTSNVGGTALVAGHAAYDVVATVTRAGSTATDATTGELTIVAGPSVDITGAATASVASVRPTISGTSTAGAVVVLRIDPNNDGNLSDAVVYAATADGSGNWSVDTSAASPISGSLPASGLTATAGLLATVTDNSNRTATDTQAITFVTPGIAISSFQTTFAANATAVASGDSTPISATVTLDGTLNAREDDSVRVQGTYTNATGAGTIQIVVTDSAGNTRTGSFAVAAAGSGVWSYDFVVGNVATSISTLKDGLLTATATFSTVSASSTILHDAAPPVIFIDSGSMANGAAATISGYAETKPSSVTVGATAFTGASITYTGNLWSVAATGVTNNTAVAVVVVDQDAAGNTTTFNGSYANYQNANVPSVLITTAAGTTVNPTPATLPSITPVTDSAVTIAGTIDNFGNGTAVAINLVISDADPATADVTTTVNLNQGNSVTNWSATNLNLHNLAYGTLTVKASVTYTNASFTNYQLYDYTGISHKGITGAITMTNPVSPGSAATVTVTDADLNVNASVAETTTATVLNVTTNETETITLTETGVNTGIFQANLNTTNAAGAGTNNTGNMNVQAGQTLTATYVDAVDAAAATNQTRTATSSVTSLVPTVTITDNVPGTANIATGNVTFTFTFSEAVTGFDINDVVVTGGTKGVFATTSSSVYTLTVIPTANTDSGSITVNVAGSAAQSVANASNSLAAVTNTQPYDTNAPLVTVTSLETLGTPTIAGTTNLPAGSTIAVTIDPDNDAATSNSVTYNATVSSGATWSVDLSSASPTGVNSLPAGGLTSYAKITASGSDAAGNTTVATALDIPTVNARTTNSGTPTVTGTWANIGGDVLTVTVNSITYPVGAALSTSGNTWTLVIPVANTLSANTYNVTATVTRGGTSVSDTTSAELIVDTLAPAVAITAINTDSGVVGDFITNDQTLVFSGTAEANSTVLVTLVNSTGTTIFSSTVAATGGVWSLDRTGQTALDAGAYTLTARATDSAGNQATATQSVEIDTVSPLIALTINSKTADTTPVITGTTDLPVGSTITVDISPGNDGSFTQSYTTTVQTGGIWSVEATTPVSGTVGVRASGTDLAGNTTATPSKPLQIVGTAPSIIITSPIASVGVDNIADSTEDDAIVLLGTTANVTVGSRITVTITDGSISITDSAVVQAGGNWTLSALNLSSMANGVISVSAEVTDTDGSVYTSSTTFTHDKSAAIAIDSISDDTGLLADFITKDNTVTITGSATANAAVVLLVKDTGNATVATFNVTTNASGAWSTTDTSALAAGSYTLAATSSGTTVTKAMTIVDVTAPVLVSSTPADDAANFVVTNDLVLTFSKNVVAGSGFISLYKSDGTLIENFNVATGIGDAGGTVVFNGTTGITVNPFNDLAAGTAYYVKVGSTAVQDSVGNVFAGISSTTALNFATAGGLDTAPPAAPTLALLASSDSGTSNSDLKTNIDTPTMRITLNGTGAAAPVVGDVVKLYQSGTLVGSATLVNADIVATTVDITTSTLGIDGTKNMTATVTDIAGNVSTASAVVAVELDRTAPALASASIVGTTLTLTYTEAGVGMNTTTPAAGDYAVLVNGVTRAVNGVTVNAVNKTVALVLSSAVVSGDVVTVSYTPGVNQLEDIAANKAVALVTNAVTNNTVAGAPTQTVTITAITDNVGSVIGTVTAGGRTDDTTPDLSGTVSANLLAGEVLRVYRNGTAIGTATVTGTNWAYADTGLADGTLYAYTARVENGGLQGAASASYGITVDTSAAAPTVVLTTDTGTSGSDRVTRTSGLTVSGTEVGATIEYSTNGTTWSTTAPTPAEGSNTVYVRQIDVAGNTSPASAALTYTIDTVAPVVASAAVSGGSLTLTYTDVNNLDATNIAATGAFVAKVDGTTVTVNNVAVDAVTKTVTLTLATAVTSGQTVTVSYTDPTAGDDTNATQDVAGNDAISFSNMAVTNNTVAGAPTQTVAITAITDNVGSVIGTVTAGGRTDDTTPDLSGTVSANLLAGEVLRVYRNGTAIGTATVTGTNWTYADTGLADGTLYAYTARVENGGVQGTASASYGITVDTSAAAPTVVLTTDTGTSGSDRVTRTSGLTVSGTEVGATIEYSTNGTTWSTTAPTPAEGSNTVYVRQIDVAGNTSPASAALTYTIDTVAPVVASAAVSGGSLTLTYTDVNNLDATNIAAAGAFVVKVDGTTVAVNNVAVNAVTKTVTLTLANAVTAGQTVTVSYTDPTAGDDTNATQDVAGNDAISFSNMAATNTTVAPPVVTPPVVTPPVVIPPVVTPPVEPPVVTPPVVTPPVVTPPVVTPPVVTPPVVTPPVVTPPVVTPPVVTPPVVTPPVVTPPVVTPPVIAPPAVTLPLTQPPVEVAAVTPPLVSPAAAVPGESQQVVVIPDEPVSTFVSSYITSDAGLDEWTSSRSLLLLDSPIAIIRNAVGGLNLETRSATTSTPVRDIAIQTSQPIENILTSRGENAFEITVISSSEPSLMRYRGIPDQSFVSTGSISIQIPVDAFVHTNVKAVVQLSARLTNGEPLPKWLVFDATTGRFSGKPPAGQLEDVNVLVEASDNEGRRAEAMFRIKMLLKKSEGRSGLSEQLRTAGRHSGQLDRLQLPATHTHGRIAG